MEAKVKLVHAVDHYSNIDESRVSLTTTLGTSLMSFCIAGDDVVVWRCPHELCADRTFPAWKPEARDLRGGIQLEDTALLLSP